MTNGQKAIAAAFRRSGTQNLAALLHFILTMQKMVIFPGFLAAADIFLLAAIATFAFWEIGYRVK